jgi:hypothetical protein
MVGACRRDSIFWLRSLSGIFCCWNFNFEQRNLKLDTSLAPSHLCSLKPISSCVGKSFFLPCAYSFDLSVPAPDCRNKSSECIVRKYCLDFFGTSGGSLGAIQKSWELRAFISLFMLINFFFRLWRRTRELRGRPDEFNLCWRLLSWFWYLGVIILNFFEYNTRLIVLILLFSFYSQLMSSNPQWKTFQRTGSAMHVMMLFYRCWFILSVKSVKDKPLKTFFFT